jgi:UDP-GlcNAc:undecaprenyl-phosphate GlcNAc-1-phosphate transferase
MRPVDLLVVPAGDADVRVPRALKLLERGRAKRVWIIPSGSGPVLNEPRAIEAFAKAEGRSGDVAVVGRRSRDLVRDARAVAARLSRTSRRTKSDPEIAVVTAPFQIARTRLVFSRETGTDVLTWRDGSRADTRGWVAVASEAGKLLGTLAVLGPGPELRPGPVPARLPLRALVGGLIVAAAAAAVCRPLARRLGMVAIPRLWRAHTTPTPMLGGLAILAGLAGGIVAAGGVRPGALGLAAGAGVVVVAVVGLIDDIAGLGVRVRLLWAAGAGTVAWLLGLRAMVVPSTGGAGDAINAAVTVLWFVGVTYALNNFDNIDGAVGGVAAISAGTFAVAGAVGGQFVVAVAGAALAGACIGYLVHNVHPARLFMGDMGALGVGFALAALGLALAPKPSAPLSMAVPVIAIGVPIFDTVMVTASRVAARRSPAEGGTDHASHRLLARGLTVRQSAAFLWGAQAVLGVLAVVSSQASEPLAAALITVFVAGGIASLVVFLRMEPWRPPWQLRASGEVVVAVERAMAALRNLEDAVGEQAWRLSNPRAARSTQETLRRLERVRHLLETAPEEG